MSERHGDRPATPDTVPAPVVTGKARTAEWVMRDSRSGDFQRGDHPTDAPAPTIGSTSRQSEWVPAGLDRRQGGGTDA